MIILPNGTFDYSTKWDIFTFDLLKTSSPSNHKDADSENKGVDITVKK